MPWSATDSNALIDKFTKSRIYTNENNNNNEHAGVEGGGSLSRSRVDSPSRTSLSLEQTPEFGNLDSGFPLSISSSGHNNNQLNNTSTTGANHNLFQIFRPRSRGKGTVIEAAKFSKRHLQMREVLETNAEAERGEDESLSQQQQQQQQQPLEFSLEACHRRVADWYQGKQLAKQK